MNRVRAVIFPSPWGRFFPKIQRDIILRRPKSVTSQLAIYNQEKIAPQRNLRSSFLPVLSFPSLLTYPEEIFLNNELEQLQYTRINFKIIVQK